MSDMSPDEKLELALQFKNRGNCFYKSEDFEEAVGEYAQVLTILENDVLFPKAQLVCMYECK